MDTAPGAEKRAVEWAMLRRELNEQHRDDQISLDHLRWFVQSLNKAERDRLVSDHIGKEDGSLLCRT